MSWTQVGNVRGPAGPPGAEVHIGTQPPESPVEGQLWARLGEDSTGTLSVFDGGQWQPVGGGGAEVHVGPTPPEPREAELLWIDTQAMSGTGPWPVPSANPLFVGNGLTAASGPDFGPDGHYEIDATGATSLSVFLRVYTAPPEGQVWLDLRNCPLGIPFAVGVYNYRATAVRFSMTLIPPATVPSPPGYMRHLVRQDTGNSWSDRGQSVVIPAYSHLSCCGIIGNDGIGPTPRMTLGQVAVQGLNAVGNGMFRSWSVWSTNPKFNPLVLDPINTGTFYDVWGATAMTVRIPSSPPSDWFEDGSWYRFMQMEAGKITVVADPDITLVAPDDKFSTRAQYSTIELLKTGEQNVWVMSGDLGP